MTIDDKTRTELEAAVFRRLVEHLRARTDVQNIGLWEGRPYLILSLGTGELAAWRIADGEIASLELQT